MNQYSTTEAAHLLGVAPITVRVNAKKLGLGRIIGRTRVLDDDDLEALRQRPKPGRPPHRKP